MDKGLKQEAILLYDRFTHEGTDRRLFMTRMVALAGSVAAAEALIATIAASPAAAAVVPVDDPRLTVRTQNLVGASRRDDRARSRGEHRSPRPDSTQTQHFPTVEPHYFPTLRKEGLYHREG